MTLTKQQKIYAAVLGLAVAAFAFDRFVLGPGDSPDDVSATSRTAPRRPARAAARPAAAAAATASAPTATPGAVILPPGAAQGPAPSVSTLALRLHQIANPPEPAKPFNLENVGDAFRPSEILAGTTKQAPVTVVEQRDAAKEFREKYKDKLMAVVKKGAVGAAIIDNKMVPIGQQFDGFRLVAVKDRSAVLWRGNQRVELRITAPSLNGSGIGGTGAASAAGSDSDASENFAGTGGQ
jgi:hypothetical protein